MFADIFDTPEPHFWGSRGFYALLIVCALAAFGLWRAQRPTFSFVGSAPPVLGPVAVSSPWPSYPDWTETGYAVKGKFVDVVSRADEQLLSSGWAKSRNMPNWVQYEETGIQQRLINLEKDRAVPGHTVEGKVVPGHPKKGWVAIYLREPRDRLDFWESTKAWFAHMLTGAP